MFNAVQSAVLSNPATQFVEALAQNAMSANYNLLLPGRAGAWFIRGFSIVSVENLIWELWLCSAASGPTAAVATDTVIGIWQFAALGASDPGAPVTGNALYRYYVDGNMMSFVDADVAALNAQSAAPMSALHLRLVNRSVAAKSAAASGALRITAHVQPQSSY